MVGGKWIRRALDEATKWAISKREEIVVAGSQMKSFLKTKWSTLSNAMVVQLTWGLRNGLWTILLTTGYQLSYIF